MLIVFFGGLPRVWRILQVGFCRVVCCFCVLKWFCCVNKWFLGGLFV